LSASETASYGRGAGVLSVGIGLTGLVTFAYFSVASYALGDVAYKRIVVLWSVMFVIMSVIYRPVEQLLSRTIADRRARGLGHGHPLRFPAALQLGLAGLFAAVAVGLHGPLRDGLFDGSEALYRVLVVGVLCYAASYFARGWLAGHERFGLYGGLVLLESCTRFCFALAVLIGLAQGQSAVALGIAAAPLISLLVVPLALRRRVARPGSAPRGEGPSGHQARFAGSVLAIMLAEQTLLNAPVLTVAAIAEDAALAGFVFNVLLIVRAPLQLFQSIQTSLLPHLARLHATDGHGDFAAAIRVTAAAIAGFAGFVTLGLLALGPLVMDVLFDDDFAYPRGALVLVAAGMGMHLVAGTLNQAALARGHAALAAASWLGVAALFLGWLLVPVIDDQLLRVAVGYCGAATALAGLLVAVYRRAPWSASSIAA